MLWLPKTRERRGERGVQCIYKRTRVLVLPLVWTSFNVFMSVQILPFYCILGYCLTVISPTPSNPPPPTHIYHISNLTLWNFYQKCLLGWENDCKSRCIHDWNADLHPFKETGFPGWGWGGGKHFFLLFKKKPSLRKQTLSLDGAYNLFRYINYVPWTYLKKKTKPIYIKIKTFLIHKLNILYFYDALQNAFVFFF